ncbi:MAG: hypothetical protein ACLTSX_03285 [Collinsella sp.]
MTLGLMVLGVPRVMTSEHCILQVAGACIHDCANCRLARPRLQAQEHRRAHAARPNGPQRP